MSPTVTIGFFPRERFVTAAESLASLYEHTPMPFTLLVVDPATPERYVRPMREVLDRHENWRILSSDRHLLPAASKNLVLAHTRDEYVCLLENDNLFNPGWLDALLAACEQHPAEVAAPQIREGRGTAGHFDHHLGTVVPSAAQRGKWEVVPADRPRHAMTERQPVEFVEQHCLLFRREVFERIGPYDEELNTRDEVDLSLALRHAGATVVLEPASVVNYVPPTSEPEDDELSFYRMRWDLDRAARSRERIRDRWNLVDTPGDLEFVRYRNLIPELPRVRRALAGLCRAGRHVVVLENGDWFGTDVTADLPLMPFPDRGGHFGGFPAGDDEAVVEMRAALAAGVTDVVVGWPARWWMDHLPRLQSALASWADSVHDDGVLLTYSTSSPWGGTRRAG
jgi:GT2 family glycosyltransferase